MIAVAVAVGVALKRKMCAVLCARVRMYKEESRHHQHQVEERGLLVYPCTRDFTFFTNFTNYFFTATFCS